MRAVYMNYLLFICSVAATLASTSLSPGGAPVQRASMSAGAACACSRLSADYEGLLLYEGSTNYTAAASGYWDLRCDLSPGCIFLPTTQTRCPGAMAVIVSCRSPFAIRGAVHMPVSPRYPAARR